VAQQQCDAAVDAAIRALQNNRQVSVRTRDLWNLSDRYARYPSGRTSGFTFILGGRMADDLMGSPQLLAGITESFISDCPSVGMVDFYRDQTDWGISFGVVSGQVREFDCINPGGPDPAWGQVMTMFQLGYARPEEWSRQLPTVNPGEVMRILTKRVMLSE